MAGRFIKLYDKMLNWEWFDCPNTLSLFIYLLLKANYKDETFQGKMIRRGQLVTSLPKLCQATGQTNRQVRDSLKHLEMTGEVTGYSTNRYRVITIVKYDEYQSADRQNGRQNDRQSGRQMTDKTADETAASIEYIELQNNRNIDKEKHPSDVKRNAQRFVPPTPDDVRTFCQENGLSVDPDRFCDYYASKGWKVGSSPMKDWKAACRNWAKRDAGTAPAPKKELPAANFEQRDYSTAPDDMMRSLAEEMRRFKESGEVGM